MSEREMAGAESAMARRDVLKSAAVATGGVLIGALVGAPAEAAAPGGPAPGSADAYAKVATVVGQVMDKAWKDILTQLASGNTAGAPGGPGAVGAADLSGFFSVLGTARMEIAFSPGSALPGGGFGSFHQIPLAPGVAVGPGGAEIGISIGIKF